MMDHQMQTMNGVTYNLDMGFILVPPDQKKIDVKIKSYADESDKGPYPLPDDAPIEGWPADGRALEQAQKAKEEGDRHVIVVDPVKRMMIHHKRGADGLIETRIAAGGTIDLTPPGFRLDVSACLTEP